MGIVIAALVGCLMPILVPVDGPVVHGFRAPACEYCPGRRGIVFASEGGAAVRAPVTGAVQFAGQVAGVLYVTIGAPGPTAPPSTEPDAGGLRVTVDRLGSIDPGVLLAASLGATVRAGRPLGRAGPTTWLSVRRGDEAIDPRPRLRRHRVSLVSPLWCPRSAIR